MQRVEFHKFLLSRLHAEDTVAHARGGIRKPQIVLLALLRSEQRRQRGVLLLADARQFGGVEKSIAIFNLLLQKLTLLVGKLIQHGPHARAFFLRQKSQALAVIIILALNAQPFANQIDPEQFTNDFALFEVQLALFPQRVLLRGVIPHFLLDRLPEFYLARMRAGGLHFRREHFVHVGDDDVADGLFRAADGAQPRDILAIILRLHLRPTKIVRRGENVRDHGDGRRTAR